MKIIFYGKTNYGNSIFLNTADFRMPSGKTVTIDRDYTSYSVKNGEIEMCWHDCYIWNGNEKQYNISKTFENSKFLCFDFEDEAPEDYRMSIERTEAVWDSTVVIGYHGTNAILTKNDFKKGENAFFTSNQDVAAFFAKQANGHVVEAKIKGYHPYVIDWEGHSWGGGVYPESNDLFREFVSFAADGDSDEIEYWIENGLCIDMFASFLSSKGYDLLIANNVREECGLISTEYVAMPGSIITDVQCVTPPKTIISPSPKPMIMTRSEFDISGFMQYIEEEFAPDRMARDVIESVVRYGIVRCNSRKDQFCFFLIDMVDCLTFREATAFADDSILSDMAIEEKKTFWSQRKENIYA